MRIKCVRCDYIQDAEPYEYDGTLYNIEPVDKAPNPAISRIREIKEERKCDLKEAIEIWRKETGRHL